MKDNVRRFTFRVYLSDGRYVDILRECNRKIPPTHTWVLNDQRELMTFNNSNEWVGVRTIDNRYEQIKKSHIVSLALIDVKEGMDIEAVKARFAKKEE